MELLDGRWASVPAVLDGAGLTHRSPRTRRMAKMLPVDPDLAPLAPLAVGGLFERQSWGCWRLLTDVSRHF